MSDKTMVALTVALGETLAAIEELRAENAELREKKDFLDAYCRARYDQVTDLLAERLAQAAEIERQRVEIERLTAAGLNCAFGEAAKEEEIEDYLRMLDQKDDRIKWLSGEIDDCLSQTKTLTARTERIGRKLRSLMAWAKEAYRYFDGDYAGWSKAARLETLKDLAPAEVKGKEAD